MKDIEKTNTQTSESLNILYTGQILVVLDPNNNSVHTNSDYRGLASPSENAAVISGYAFRNDISNNSYQHIISTTIHESLHMLGVSHCACGCKCIMVGKNKGDTTTDLEMCELCWDLVEQYKFKLYNHNN